MKCFADFGVEVSLWKWQSLPLKNVVVAGEEVRTTHPTTSLNALKADSLCAASTQPCPVLQSLKCMETS